MASQAITNGSPINNDNGIIKGGGTIARNLTNINLGGLPQLTLNDPDTIQKLIDNDIANEIPGHNQNKNNSYYSLENSNGIMNSTKFFNYNGLVQDYVAGVIGTNADLVSTIITWGSDTSNGYTIKSGPIPSTGYYS